MKMREVGDRLFFAAMAVSAVIAAAGVATGFYGSTIPVFAADRELVANAFTAWCTSDLIVNDAAGARYLALFTAHYTLVDIGIGLVLSGVTLARLTFVLRMHGPSEGTWLRTPAQRSTYLIVGSGALVWFFVSVIESLRTDLERMLFPSCADSIGIPIYGVGVTAVLTFPIALLAGWMITRLFGCLPAPLTQWDSARPAKSWILTGIFGLGIVCLTIGLVESLPTSMSVSALSFIVGIYLLASARAGILSPKVRKA
jgi:hypothetical protein